MRGYTCPACGAPGTFQSPISVYAVCAYCQSMILRRDLDVEAFGKMAQLPPDMSPLQLGARGEIDGLAFTLAGRVRIGWENGAWNEWFLVLEDARRGWLAEAQGTFAVCFEAPLVQNGRDLINRKLATWKPKPGERVNVGEKAYEVADIKQTVCLGSEGELPYLANRGRKALSIDFAGGDGFACLEIQRQELGHEARFYAGQYVEWEELKLENTRPLEGW